MSLGFAALSRVVPIIEMVGGVDINADALATYNHNFAAPGVRVDIRTLVDDDAALANFLDMLPRYNAARPTIVIGCAPCQGFTSHRKRHWGTDDHRNTLVGAFTSVAIKLNADCVVMENVPEMLSLKYWDHFNDAKVLLEEAGYTVSQTIYSAASFGVPQERFRALVVAMKRPFLLPELQISEPSRYRTVRDAIGKLPLVSPGVTHPRDPMHRSAAHRESTLHTIRAVPKDGGSRPPGVGPKCLDRIRGFYDVYGRLAWDRPAITITHYARNPASGRYVHPEQDRGLTAREAALLQSFPLGFSFTGGFDSVFKQIGEAVSPRFAAAVAANCLVEMLSAQPTHEQCDRSVQPITTPVSSSFSSVIAGLKRARNRR
jgi:DNA (cytosine-5)-methyltransferase 1